MMINFRNGRTVLIQMYVAVYECGSMLVGTLFCRCLPVIDNDVYKCFVMVYIETI